MAVRENRGTDSCIDCDTSLVASPSGSAAAGNTRSAIVERTRDRPSADASDARVERVVDTATAYAGDVGAARAIGRPTHFDATGNDCSESGRAFARTGGSTAGAGSKRASSRWGNRNAARGHSSQYRWNSGESSVARQAFASWWDAGSSCASHPGTGWNAGALRSAVREHCRPSAYDGCANRSLCAAAVDASRYGRTGLTAPRGARVQGSGCARAVLILPSTGVASCPASDRSRFFPAPQRPGFARHAGAGIDLAATGESGGGESSWITVRSGGFVHAGGTAGASRASANQSVPRQ